MNKILSIVAAFLLLSSWSVSAQMFTSSPSPLQEASRNVVLTFHADKSEVPALQGLPASTELYLYTGVMTNKSPNSWKYLKEDWNKPTAATKLTYVSANTYTINLGDIRSYYGVTDATEHITKLCLIAKTKDGSKQTKDCFLEVVEDGFAMTFIHDQPATAITKPTKFTFTLGTTQTAALDIKVNGVSIASTNGTQLVKDYTFASAGNYTVVATAKAGNETLTETINIIYLVPSAQQNYPGGVPKMGPVVNADGSVTFCLAAPQKNVVMIVGSWDDYATVDKNIMKYQDYNGCRYFWTTITGLDPNKDYIYYFNVDGIYNVGDPYARLALDPYNDKWLSSSVFPDRPQYPYTRFDDRCLAVHRSNFAPYNWKVKNFNIPSHDQLVIYEMLFRDFTGDEGLASGNGTIAKAIDKISYLTTLGVNAVEVMPVMEFNGNNSWGYNTNFYFALDKSYGSPVEFKRFVDLCHENGIAVILDIVFNHSDGLHPWYQMYNISNNPFYNATCPHNWGVLNDWKQENQVVQQQFKDVLQFWMREYNVDGYRFDLVKGLGTSYGETDGYNASRIPVMKAFHNAIKEVKPNGIHINEFLGDFNEELQYCNDGQIGWNNQSGNSQTWAKGAGTPNLNYYSAVNCSRPWGTTVGYIESHDEERVGYVAKTSGSAAVKGNKTFNTQNLGSLAVQMLMTPGPQMIWQFGELGADETTKNSDGNDTKPKTVIYSRLNDADYAGLYKTYCDLIWLRRSNPELFAQNVGSFNYNGSVQRQGQFVSGNKEVVVLINPSASAARDISFTPQKMSASNYQLISSSHGTNKPTLVADGSKLKANIQPRCYAVFASKAVSGVEDITADILSNDVVVVGGEGEIIVAGDYTNAEVYNLAGQRFNTLNVPAGVYIVRVDGNVSKVVVR